MQEKASPKVFRFASPDSSSMPDLTATKTVEHPTVFAEHLFDTPIEVTEKDCMPGLASILEKKLIEGGLLNSLTPPERKNGMIDVLEKELQRLGSDGLKKIGFGSGTIGIIRPGEKLDLSILKETMYRIR